MQGTVSLINGHNTTHRFHVTRVFKQEQRQQIFLPQLQIFTGKVMQNPRAFREHYGVLHFPAESLRVHLQPLPLGCHLFPGTSVL